MWGPPLDASDVEFRQDRRQQAAGDRPARGGGGELGERRQPLSEDSGRSPEECLGLGAIWPCAEGVRQLHVRRGGVSDRALAAADPGGYASPARPSDEGAEPPR